MPRAVNNVAAKAKHKKFLKLAKGYRLSKSKLFKTAKETVQRALAYAYRDRKAKKRSFRQLWIARINAACRMNDLSYSRFISGLKTHNIALNRQSLAELAMNNPDVFNKICAQVKA
jgi:large subunit ribosomal protein L20